MRIDINNFGPIKSFSFDIKKNLHVIFGKNNVGKSYAIIALYIILKQIIQYGRRDVLRVRLLFGGKLDKAKASFVEIIRQKLNKQNQNEEIDITNDISEIFKSFFTIYFIPEVSRSLNNSFSSLSNIQNKLSDEELSIKLIFDIAELQIKYDKSKDEMVINSLTLNQNIGLKSVATNRKPVISNNHLVLYFNRNTSEIFNFDSFISSQIQKMFNEVVDRVQEVYFLPASRSGLYQALNAFSAIIAELSQSRQFLRSKIELPNISEPLSDYYLNLSSIKDSTANKENPNSIPFVELATNIESDILKGVVKFNQRTKKLSYFQSNLGLDLDLSATSSMISEMVPIVAHLKFILAEKPKPSLIFIEEPEAHLHPEIQTKLIEFFAKLSSHKLKIVMTSHSNYMLNKLTNLIIGNTVDPDIVSTYLLRMSENGSIVDLDSMKVSKDGIADDNFGDIAEDLYAEREKLFSIQS